MTLQHDGAASRRLAGVVVAPERGALGSHRLHGVRLMDHARKALADVPGCDVVLAGEHGADRGLPLSQLLSGYDLVLVHDPLCPLLPASTLADCARAVPPGGAAVGVLPVTDTVKRIDGDVITSTVDRDALRVLAAPVAFATSLLPVLEHRLPRARDLGDLARLVDLLADLGPVVPVQVPSFARRVADADDVAVLECLDGLRHTLRER